MSHADLLANGNMVGKYLQRGDTSFTPNKYFSEK